MEEAEKLSPKELWRQIFGQTLATIAQLRSCNLRMLKWTQILTQVVPHQYNFIKAIGTFTFWFKQTLPHSIITFLIKTNKRKLFVPH